MDPMDPMDPVHPKEPLFIEMSKYSIQRDIEFNVGSCNDTNNGQLKLQTAKQDQSKIKVKKIKDIT